jgi:hypothetical protein
MTKPFPDETNVRNELRGASAYFTPPTPAPPETPRDLDRQSTRPSTDQAIDQSGDPSVMPPTGRPDDQSADRAVDPTSARTPHRPTDRMTARILDRPKAFYITEELDRRLDETVRYVQEHHRVRRVDRSTVVNALLSDDALWSRSAIDRLVDRVVDQLTNRLVDQS